MEIKCKEAKAKKPYHLHISFKYLVVLHGMQYTTYISIQEVYYCYCLRITVKGTMY